MRRLIRVLSDPAELAAAAAGEFARASGAHKGKGTFRAALSGGSTPKALYARLAAEPLRSRVPWARVELFFGDERCVPPDDPDSNYRMAREALLSRVPVPPERVHRVLTERTPEEAARLYADEVRGPRFDWIFLGLGPDGHTASLFPGTAAVEEKEKLAVSVWVPEKKTRRVTLTLPVLNAAAKVVFVVSGADKADAVRRVLEEPASPAVPASLVRPEAGELLWLLDAAAASGLRRTKC